MLKENYFQTQLLLLLLLLLFTTCRSLGPQAVLEVLPLQINEGLAGTAEARTWLLPALRKHVHGSQLGFWASHLGPLAKQMGAAAAAASQAGRKSTAVACHALELQLWGCLQAFAAWPTDAATAYEGELS
jgi:ribosomal RNA-processing protein 12